MEFDFTAEQYALRDMARDLFEKESPPSRLRELYEGGERDPGVWRSMASVGLLGLTIPEQLGGMGGDEVDLALVLEEAGRAALPEPLLETVAVAAPALAEAGGDPAEQWLPRIATGDAIVTVRLDGTPFAVDADVADVLLEERDGVLHLIERGAFTTQPVTSEDRARRLFAIEPTSGGTVLGDAARRAADRSAVAAAGMLNGIAMRLIQMTLAYVKDRQQFGRPVGSFQALKHRLADVQIAVEAARAATWYAAYAIARGLDDSSLAAAVAKTQATEAEALANRAALQFHAGIGFTWEHDLHLWLKRGKALEQAYGSTAVHRARIARHVFDDGGSRA